QEHLPRHDPYLISRHVLDMAAGNDFLVFISRVSLLKNSSTKATLVSVYKHDDDTPSVLTSAEIDFPETLTPLACYAGEDTYAILTLPKENADTFVYDRIFREHVSTHVASLKWSFPRDVGAELFFHSLVDF